eukprot:66482_1
MASDVEDEENKLQIQSTTSTKVNTTKPKINDNGHNINEIEEEKYELDVNRINEKDQNNEYACICGNTLRVTLSEYQSKNETQTSVRKKGVSYRQNNDIVICNYCFKIICGKMYKCEAGSRIEHENGFNLCDNCIIDQNHPQNIRKQSEKANAQESAVINSLISKIHILGKSDTRSTISDEEFSTSINKDDTKYILSRSSLGLLTLIEFREAVDLEEITLFASCNEDMDDDMDDDMDEEFRQIDYLDETDRGNGELYNKIFIYKIDNLMFKTLNLNQLSASSVACILRTVINQIVTNTNKNVDTNVIEQIVANNEISGDKLKDMLRECIRSRDSIVTEFENMFKTLNITKHEWVKILHILENWNNLHNVNFRIKI